MSYARVRALIVLGVLAVAALVFVTVALVRDTQSNAQVVENCPEGYDVADISLPEPKDVKLRVLNGTETDGTGQKVSDDFANRKFQVSKPENNDKVVAGVATLRYGPKAVGGAHLLRAYFLDQADRQYDRTRKNDVVDVIIGSDFKQLATTTEVNQSLVELGQPELPPQACAAPES